MMKFYKYHGAGNDFIILNDIEENIPEISTGVIKKMCHRRFGIGADGLMILKKHDTYDFEMDYYNADGSGATLCGNGGRCIVAFARKLNIIDNETVFLASDGLHEAIIEETGEVRLKMNDIDKIENVGNAYTCYTGSPHYIKFVSDLKEIDVYNEGRTVRNSERYRNEGINVNFVKEEAERNISLRTYERGVEDETFACGTGSVAAALTHANSQGINSGEYTVNVKGGTLTVSFNKKDTVYTDIWLSGPAEFVFEGNVDLKSLN